MIKKLAELAVIYAFCAALVGICILGILWPILKVAAVIKYLLS